MKIISHRSIQLSFVHSRRTIHLLSYVRLCYSSMVTSCCRDDDTRSGRVSLLPSSPVCAILPAYSETTPETQNGRNMGYRRRVLYNDNSTFPPNSPVMEASKGFDHERRYGMRATWLHSSFMHSFSTTKIMHFESFNESIIGNGTGYVGGKADVLWLKSMVGKILANSVKKSKAVEALPKDKGKTGAEQGIRKKMEFLWRYSRYRAGEKSGWQSPLIPFLPPFLQFPFSSPLQNSFSSSYF